MEVWKPLQEYEDLYEISSYGRFRSKERIVVINNIPRRRAARYRKPIFINKKGGFYTVALIRDGVRKNPRFAPLVAKHFLESPPHTPQDEVGFKDGNRHNLRADNLYWRAPESTDVSSGKLLKGTTNLYITENGELYRLREGEKHIFRGHRHRLGYIKYTYVEGGKPVSISAHRLVAEYYVPNPKPDEYNVVDHIDGNPFNNHYTNLRWCTQTMNMQYGKKILPFVPYIKYYLSIGYTNRDLAIKYGVDCNVISRIRNGRTYRNIKMEKPNDTDRI